MPIAGETPLAEGDRLVLGTLQATFTWREPRAAPPRPALAERVTTVLAIADALAAAHEQGLVHGALGRRAVQLEGGRATIDFSGAGGTLMEGDYRAPEQLRGMAADAAADVFAAGCLFYETLGGQRAFVADTLSGLMYQVMHEDPPPLTTLVPGLPASVSDVVARALAKDPAQRFPDARALRDALRAAIDAWRSA
jgi:serine/threonine-protein kinase